MTNIVNTQTLIHYPHQDTFSISDYYNNFNNLVPSIPIGYIRKLNNTQLFGIHTDRCNFVFYNTETKQFNNKINKVLYFNNYIFFIFSTIYDYKIDVNHQINIIGCLMPVRCVPPHIQNQIENFPALARDITIWLPSSKKQ